MSDNARSRLIQSPSDMNKAVSLDWNEETGAVDSSTLAADVDLLVSLIQNGKVSYPYRRYYTPEEETPEKLFDLLKTEEVIKNIKKYTPADLRVEGSRYEVSEQLDTWTLVSSRAHNLTDWYSEPARVRAKAVNGNYSMYELWMSMTREVVLNCITRWDRITMHSLHATLRGLAYTKTSIGQLAGEAFNFSNVLAREIYRVYCPQGGVVLDPSAGWGDRELGALASGTVSHYIGVDPNEYLYTSYYAMKSLNPSVRVTILGHGAEQLPYEEKESVDVVFTSPPYWNLEVYTQLPGQSIDVFSSFDSWLNGFLFEMIQRAYYRLKRGGYFLLHVRNIRGVNLVGPIIEKMNELGAIYHQPLILNIGSIAPVWRWQKP